MPAEMLCCPYCNSEVALAGGFSSGGQVRCPRCQETFPYRAGEQSPELDNGQPVLSEPTEPQVEPVEAPASPPRHWSNRSVAGVVLTVMACMAGIGLIFAWYTTEWRRHRDTLSPSADVPPPRAVVVAPAKLAGLGFLPADTDIVVGLQVAELLEQKQDRDLVSTLLSAANLHSSDLEQWIGLKMEHVNHVLVGVKTRDRLLPRVTLIVQTCRLYDSEKLRAKLKVSRSTERAGRTIYRFSPNETSLEPAVWLAGDRILVLGLLPEELDDVPLASSPITDRLDPRLVGLVEALKEGTQAWLVGLARDWDRFLQPGFGPGTLQLPIPGLTKEAREPLAKIRDISAWIQVDKEVDLQVVVGFSDQESAQRLRELLWDKKSPLGIDRQKLEEFQIHLEAKEDRLEGKAKISVDTLEEMMKR
jgi:hypothetical protein